MKPTHKTLATLFMVSSLTSLGACSLAATTPITEPKGSQQPNTEAPPSDIHSAILSVTKDAVIAYNTGNLDSLLSITCGALFSDLDNSSREEFKRSARDDLNKHGIGSVENVSQAKELNGTATADLSVRYEKWTDGLDDSNSIALVGVYKRIGERWKICGLDPR